MKPLIDARGRLFGRWNVVDVGVMAIVAALAYGGVVAYRVMSGEIRAEPAIRPLTLTAVSIDAEVELHDLTPELAARIQPGDTQQDAAGHELARIMTIRAPLAPDRLRLMFGSRQVDVKHPQRFRLPVTMTLTGDVKGYTFFYEGKPIGESSLLEFQTPDYAVPAQIMKLLEAPSLSPPAVSSPPVDEAPDKSPRPHRVRLMIDAPAEDLTKATLGIGASMVLDEAQGLWVRLLGFEWVEPRAETQPIEQQDRKGRNKPNGQQGQPSQQETDPGVFRLIVQVGCSGGPQRCPNSLMGFKKVGEKVDWQFDQYRLVGTVTASEMLLE